MKDAINKAARIVINNFFEHRISTIIFGGAKEQKQKVI